MKAIFFSFSLVCFLNLSCKKFLDVGNPPDKIVAKYVYEFNESASAVLTGIYPALEFVHGQSGISFNCGLSADEFNILPTAYGAMGFYTNSTNSGDFFWITLYRSIYKINSAIEGLSGSSSLSPAVKKQLEGEAYFLRAFCYFYLVNFYGNVPILIKSDYKENLSKRRMPVEDVYAQIVADLEKAKEMLNSNYVAADVISNTNERIRPNKFSAIAFLARVYLYHGDWAKAVENSSMVIENKDLYNLTDLNDVFIKNSQEAIWQIQPQLVDGTFFNTLDARMFVLDNGPDDTQHPAWLSPFLLNSFEAGDKRRTEWVGADTLNNNIYNYAYKYKLYRNDEPQLEYVMIFRLAEQYLIRAEANAELGNTFESRQDINTIRIRANLNQIEVSTKEELLTQILHERQIEFFSEWGHRWLDLKRTNRLNSVMSIVAPQKGGSWEAFKKLYPIPSADIKLNRNLTQNEGYSL